MRQRSLAVFLSLIMVMSLAPVSALAADETEDNNGTTIEVGTKEMLTQAFERVKNEESELWTIFLSDDIVLADKPAIPSKSLLARPLHYWVMVIRSLTTVTL